MRFFQEVRMDVIANSTAKKFSIPNLLYLLLLSPEFQLITSYRIQHRLINLSILGKVLAKILWYISTIITSCHIDPRAKIAGGLRLPHGTSIVISRYAVINSGVTIYQNVTIGAKNDKAPILEENVVIYPGAVVIGDINIGKDAIVGANAVLVDCLAKNKVAVCNKAKVIN